jgi:hypothetical protein
MLMRLRGDGALGGLSILRSYAHFLVVERPGATFLTDRATQARDDECSCSNIR